jgi:hypothetical protein
MRAVQWGWIISHSWDEPHEIIQADETMYMVKNSTRDNIGITQRGVEK